MKTFIAVVAVVVTQLTPDTVRLEDKDQGVTCYMRTFNTNVSISCVVTPKKAN